KLGPKSAAAETAIKLGQLFQGHLAVAVGVHGVEVEGDMSGLIAERVLHRQFRRRQALGLVLVQHAVAVAVQVAEQPLEIVVPGGLIGRLERLAVEIDVETKQHGPAVTEEDEVLDIAGRSSRPGTGGQGNGPDENEQETEEHGLHSSKV